MISPTAPENSSGLYVKKNLQNAIVTMGQQIIQIKVESFFFKKKKKKDPAVKVKPESTKGYKPQIQSENNMAAALKTRDL